MDDKNDNSTKQNKAVSYRQLSQISEAALLEEASHTRLILKSIIIVFTLMVLGLIWAAFVTIDEVSVSYRELVPKGNVQVIQHLEGGVVQRVFVSNGDVVKKGQMLLKLNDEGQEAELRQLRSQEISLILDSSRLNAFLVGGPPDVTAWAESVVRSKYNPVKQKHQIATLLEDQKKLLEQQYAKLRNQSAALTNTIVQREEKLAQLKKQKEIWKRHISLLIQEFNMYQKLKEKNYVSQKDYLTALRAVNQAKGDGAKIDSDMEQTIEGIKEAKNKLKELTSTAHEDALEKLSKINSDLLDVRHRIEKLVERINRTGVRSPIDGVVKGLEVSPGNVVKPGGTILEVVPEGGELIAECKITPKEVGYIRIGSKVNVKILTYDYSRFGSIEGRLHSISASTFDDEKDKPYYKARIFLKKQYIGSKEAPKTLRAGMTVQADIITGEKTLLGYLLKPIQRSISGSFHER